MKKNIFIIIVFIILILIIFIQLIYFNFTKNSDIKNEEQTVSETRNTDGIIYNINNLFNYYSEITVSTKQMEETVDDLITNKFIKIRNETINNTPSQNKEYYVQHKKELDDMGILTSIDFIMIAEQMKNVLKDEKLMPREINVNIDENEINDKDYYKFDLIISYINNAKINLKCLVKKQINIKEQANNKIDNKIYFQSNSNLDKIFKSYNRNLNPEEFVLRLNAFIDGFQQIYNNTRLNSLNNQAQYYNFNLLFLNNMGIYSEEDFQYISAQIDSNINWNSQTSFSYYDVTPQNYVEKDGYLCFEVRFIFNQFEEFKITAEVAINDLKPSVKFTAKS